MFTLRLKSWSKREAARIQVQDFVIKLYGVRNLDWLEAEVWKEPDQVMLMSRIGEPRGLVFGFAHERWKRAPDTSGEWEGSRGAGHCSRCVALKRNNSMKMNFAPSLGAHSFTTAYLLFMMGCVAQKVSWHLFAAEITQSLLRVVECRAHVWIEPSHELRWKNFLFSSCLPHSKLVKLKRHEPSYAKKKIVLYSISVHIPDK